MRGRVRPRELLCLLYRPRYRLLFLLHGLHLLLFPAVGARYKLDAAPCAPARGELLCRRPMTHDAPWRLMLCVLLLLFLLVLVWLV